MGLLGRVFNNGIALRPDGGHHDVHGSAHRHHVQIDAGALQAAVLCGGVDKAAFHHHLGAQGGEALHVLVDGADAEIAAAGHGALCLAEPAKQCADEIVGGPHLPGQLIGGPGGADVAGVDLHRVAVDDTDARAQMLQNLQGQRHIGDLGDVLDPADPVHQQRGGENGDSSVLGAADLYFTKQGMTTLHNILCQSRYPLFKRRFLLWRHPCFSIKQCARPVRLHTSKRPGKAAEISARKSSHTQTIPYPRIKCKPFLQDRPV